MAGTRAPKAEGETAVECVRRRAPSPESVGAAENPGLSGLSPVSRSAGPRLCELRRGVLAGPSRRPEAFGVSGACLHSRGWWRSGRFREEPKIRSTQARSDSNAMHLSIIIPTRRLDDPIRARAGENARRAAAREVVVVEPRDLAEEAGPGLPHGWRLVTAPRGRGPQCAAGAAAARGELLLFLHDDTDLPDNAGSLIRAAFADPAVGMACFRLRFDRRHWLLRLYEACSRIESPMTTFGDQAMVLRRTVYDSLGGFPHWPLFEDVELARRARRHSRIVKLPGAVITSASRFTANGVLRQQLANGLLLARFWLGTPPERLAMAYEQQRGAVSPGEGQ